MIFGKGKDVERLEEQVKALEAENDRLRRRVRLMSGEGVEGSLSMRASSAQTENTSHSIHGLETCYLVVDEELKVRSLNSKMCQFLGIDKSIATKRLPVQQLDRLDFAPEVLSTLLLEAKSLGGPPALFEAKRPGQGKEGPSYFQFKGVWTGGAGTITVEDVTLLRRTRQTFERLVSPRIVAEVLDSGADVLSANDRVMTVLFADLRGFTDFCEQTAPDVVARVVNEFMSGCVTAVEAHGATLDKFVGDQVMVLFGAPVVRDDHAYQAVRFALDLVQHHQTTRNRWIETGLLRRELLEQMPKLLELGIGINTGEMVLGLFGDERSSQYTVMGHEVNLSARLCGKADAAEILCGMRTVNEIAALYKSDPARFDLVLKFKRKGEVEVKGVHEPVPVATLVYGQRM